MKRFVAVLAALALALGACASGASSWQEQYDLGIRCLEAGDYEEAVLAFTAAIEIDPMRPEAYVGRGDARRQLGELEGAQQDYRKALELNESDDSTSFKLAEVLLEQGRPEEAAVLLEDLLEGNPSNPDYYDRLADCYDQMGEKDQARQILEDGVSETGDQGLSSRLEEYGPESGLPPVPDDGISREVVEITSGEELMEYSFAENVKNLEIRLGDGDYNVDSFMLMDAENVSIIGTGSTRLVSSSGAETILSMFQCDNILLYGLVMGHDLEPYMTCSTGVLELLSSSDVKIVGCDIYGCGLQGINASYSSFAADSTIVRDCSEHGAILYASQGTFNDCTFSGNCYQSTANPVFRVNEASSSVTLSSCTLQDNLGQSKYVLNDGAEWTESDTIETGNAWQ